KRPKDVALRTLLHDAEQQLQITATEEARKKEADQRLAQLRASQKKQEELAREAEAARQRAVQDAAKLDETGKKVLDQKRDKAHEQLVSQANSAVTKKDLVLATALLGSAIALKPSDTASRDLAKLRAEQQDAAKKHAEEEQKKRETEKLKKQEAELAK